MKNKDKIKSMSIEELEVIKANIDKRDLQNKLIEDEAIKNNIEQHKTKRVKTEEEKQQSKERKMQRTEAAKKRREEAEERIKAMEKAKKEAERQKFLDSLAFDVRKPVEIDPIYDNKPVFKTEKSEYDLIRGAKGSRAIENSKIIAAQDAVIERKIKMLQAIERLKKQQQIVEDEEQEL